MKVRANSLIYIGVYYNSIYLFFFHTAMATNIRFLEYFTGKAFNLGSKKYQYFQPVISSNFISLISESNSLKVMVICECIKCNGKEVIRKTWGEHRKVFPDRTITLALMEFLSMPTAQLSNEVLHLVCR